ncbi:anthranilate phosphoribosyltransferase [Mesobacillus sp. AQ2]|jgi:anthranilate phosphoribosyltransferase|uniref:anthranilate phosphoribosyltransferase n=1 Tax=Bacillaceae TaxID=186817 RepID=UPI0011A24681|nr:MULTISPECIES: anthranilate phosphoribosyltransferase [Bacillaceae]MCM3122002.1 anthranilate phosphoribosyltransferase [Mesobacillus sp. MER 33]MCM3231966.1 anthranilate phosphoribosyltransferase [Mesobacillus sp. MER 48]WHX38923.1 anthranilate phosphoribosyltransferase [Mesobacillus sp. AQ2]
MKHYLEKLVEGKSLLEHEMEEAVRGIFTQDTTDSEIASFLTGLKSKGETAEEVSGLVKAIRTHALNFTKKIPNVLDNCGTGGDGSKSFNISTTSAFVIAGAGITVAKHGNRSVSSKTGSADVLEALGVSLDFSPEATEEILEQNGIAFLFAPHVHPKLKQIMKVRRDLKIPTIFNLIGPLTNPVHLDYQLLGIYRRDMLDKFAHVLSNLNRKRAIVINGAGGMDEASLAGENELVIVSEGEIDRFKLQPEEVNLPVYDNSRIRGGDARDNAEILLQVLKSKEGAHRDTVLLNAGLGIYTAGKAETILDGVNLAAESIDSGKALAKLENLISISNRNKKAVG